MSKIHSTRHDGEGFGSRALRRILPRWPALRASRADLAGALKDGARSISGGTRLRSLLVVGQFALSLPLLASAGLVLRSFAKVLEISQ